MAESYKALCNDFYVNMKLTLKMDLPKSRESLLDMFERLRRTFPEMKNFRRYKDECALESPQVEFPHRWAAVKGSHLRSGTVNADLMDDAYTLHHMLLKLAPSYLSISPLDVDYMELLYGFDLHAPGNHDSIVLDALLAGSPLSALIDVPDTTPIDFQPMVGLAMPRRGDLEVFFEVKTRPGQGQIRREPQAGEPISIYLTLRKFGPIEEITDLPGILTDLSEKGEELVRSRVVPGLLVPIREAIGSGNP
jgi:hypothetical protein